MVAESYAVGRGRLGIFGQARAQTPTLVGFGLSAGVAAASGGYFPASWGVTSLVLLALAAALLLGGTHRLSRADLIFVAGFAALLGWTALSALWSQGVPQTMHEVERTLVYAAAAFALVLLARGDRVAQLLGGSVAGTTAIAAYALATRLFPDRLGVDDALAGARLAAPIGYWNGLGLFCASGALLAAGLAARKADRRGRALAAAAIPVLTTALFFTFSRGAWIALAVGLAAMLALTHERLRLVGTLAALVPASAAAILLASRQPALTHTGAVASAAAREGHRLAPALALLGLASAVSLLGAVALQRRIRLGHRARRAAGAGLVATALVVLVTAAALAPWSTAKPAIRGDLNHRVVSVSTNGRTTLWHLALDDARSHPLLGSGAGTYEQYFDRHRDTASLTVRDAHSLYLETLAELGPVGLVLLALALALPAAAAVRARRDGLAVAAAGAYAAFLAHAAWDWDWELPAVTLGALVAGVALLARARETGLASSMRSRIVLAAALVVPAAFAVATLVGDRASSDAQQAAAAGRWTEVAAKAHRATRLTPWAPEPWEALAQARLAGADFAGARTALQHALRLDPRSWQLWLDLAIATDGRDHAAALARARALNPLQTDFPE